MKRKKIGEVLIEAGLVAPEQVENALLVQRNTYKRLGKILVELGYVTERQIARYLSELLKIDLVDCEAFEVKQEVLEKVPRKLAEEKVVFPLAVNEGTLLLAMADPLDWQTVDTIRFRSGMKVSISVAEESVILDLLEMHYGSAGKIFELIRDLPHYDNIEFLPGNEDEGGQIELGDSDEGTTSPPIVKLVTMVIADAVDSRASDIHIEPQENGVKVRYRIDGALRAVLKYPKRIQEEVISRIKIIAGLDITKRRIPQDGSSTVMFHGQKVDLRISTMPTVHGEKVVIRILNPKQGIISFSDIGMRQPEIQSVLEVIGQPQGMLIVTGPTGSGKSTTLYALLRQLQTEAANIVTIEDPVEYKLPGITQVGINEAVGLTFANVLRSVLRQDPDIIMVGEIRDRETAEIAARAALTGHLVLTTLHTNDTVSSIFRLIDIGLERYMVTSAVSGVLAQRLYRKVCPECRTAVVPHEDWKVPGLPRLKQAYMGAGCKTCLDSGYRGRTGVFEFLKITPELRRVIAAGAAEDDIRHMARRAGTVPLFEAGWERVRDGLTTFDEFITKTPMIYWEEKSHSEEPESEEGSLPYTMAG